MLQNQIDLIKDKNIKSDVEYIMSKIPEYFWKVPASSTGKYHPEFSLGEGGLLRHTKAAVKIAQELFELNDFSDFQKDWIIASLIMHDGLKYGFTYDLNNYFCHPIYMAQFIKKLFDQNELKMTYDDMKIITEAIACHMGKWNTNKYSTVELPVPVSDIEKFIHMCDYLSSRKFIDIKFQGGEI